MTPPTPSAKSGRALAWSIGIVGTFLIMGALVWALIVSTRPEPLAALRAAERVAFLAEVRAAEAQALNEYGWVDQAKGIVRLPIREVLPLVEREWRDPAAARSNLIARVLKATEVAPPPPAAPNPYE
jgi:hypothetical protein